MYKIGNISFTIKKDYLTFVYKDQHSFDLNINSSCNNMLQKEIHISSSLETIQKKQDYIQVIFDCKSNIWKLKKVYFEIYKDRIEYYFRINDKDICIDNITYFEYLSHGFNNDYDKIKHLSDKKKSHYREYSTANKIFFDQIFSPEINNYSKNYFEPFENFQISANSDLDFEGGNFITSPAILCYAFRANQSLWLSMGLIADDSEYIFSEYEYIGGKHFGLNINYWGYKKSLKFQSPKIAIHFSNNEYSCLNKYVTSHFKVGKKLDYEWWKKPIVCGWGHQCYMADIFRTRSPKERRDDQAAHDSCTEHNYEYILKCFIDSKVDWGTFIIDAKWYLSGGLKDVDIGRWPNLKGFVNNVHKLGKKILIWWSPWLTDGLDKSLCITYNLDILKSTENRDGRFKKFGGFNHGDKIAPDITLPKVQKLVAKQLDTLLSPSGFDFDGLKVDHLAAVPGIYGMDFPNGSKHITGIELNKFYMNYIYKKSKEIKHDSLIIGQSPNPYFQDCQDMIRLGDLYINNGVNIIEQMTMRQKLAKIACPNLLIDTDGWPMPNLDTFQLYSKYSKKLGVSSLYYCSYIDHSQEKIPLKIFLNINKSWRQKY